MKSLGKKSHASTMRRRESVKNSGKPKNGKKNISKSVLIPRAVTGPLGRELDRYRFV